MFLHEASLFLLVYAMTIIWFACNEKKKNESTLWLSTLMWLLLLHKLASWQKLSRLVELSDFENFFLFLFETGRLLRGGFQWSRIFFRCENGVICDKVAYILLRNKWSVQTPLKHFTRKSVVFCFMRYRVVATQRQGKCNNVRFSRKLSRNVLQLFR